jgi:hypothetical protein
MLPTSACAATLSALRARLPELRRQWSAPEKPFPYVVIDDFLPAGWVEEILATYPLPDIPGWDTTTYTHQRKKFTRVSGFPTPIADFFAFTASEELRLLVGEVTGIADLLDDQELVGGGLHQILRGGFLDVHVDYNFHPTTKLHRRLNLLLYLNRDWKPEYEGCLELWDLPAKRQIEHIAPLLNRAVMFETSEVSYHGHPAPLNCPPNVTRKSLAVYYYTRERPPATIAPEHNTLYRQTTGARGYVKTVKSSTVATMERTGTLGLRGLGRALARKAYRLARGLPPENS